MAGDKESYVFALTSENFDWQTIPLGEQALSDKVAAIRRGFDVDKPELFDLGLAQELYASLLGPIDATRRMLPLTRAKRADEFRSRQDRRAPIRLLAGRVD